MTGSAEANEVSKPRLRSPEEMEEAFRQIRARGPEGARLVEVHKKLIAMLDAMIEKRGQRRAGAGRDDFGRRTL